MLLIILKWIPFICVFILLGMFIRVVKASAKKDSEINRLKTNAQLDQNTIQVLLGSVGPDAVLWRQHDNLDIDQVVSIHPDKMVIITARDLGRIYAIRYNQGASDTRTANNPYPICNDKSYDGLYREHVNKLTAIAREFYGAGQLRSRIQDVVINFRHELAAMQMGLKQIPGKKNMPSISDLKSIGVGDPTKPPVSKEL